MRRRAVLVASLLASLVAHAAALVALSSWPPEGRDTGTPIDVEMLAPLPQQGRGVALPASPSQARPEAAQKGDAEPLRGADGGRATRTVAKARAVALELAAPPNTAPELVAEAAKADEIPRASASAPAQPAGAGESAAAPERVSERGGGGGVAAGSLVAVAPARDLGDAPRGSRNGLTADESAGFRRPEQAQRNCVQDAVRLPSSLRGFVSRTFSVRFAVSPDGTPGELQILEKLPDDRVGGAIWRAIQACRWTPGTDDHGRPAKVWIVMPIRFERG